MRKPIAAAMQAAALSLICPALASAKPPGDAQGFCDWLAVSAYEEQEWLESRGREALDAIHAIMWNCDADGAKSLTLTVKGHGEISPLDAKAFCAVMVRWIPEASAVRRIRVHDQRSARLSRLGATLEGPLAECRVEGADL